VNGAGDAEVLHHSLSSDIGSVGPQLLRQRRLDKGDPAGHPFYFVPGSEHSTICTLDKFTSSLATLAPSSRPSLLRQYRTIPQIGELYQYIMSSQELETISGRPYL